jgi:hypothetical protein
MKEGPGNYQGRHRASEIPIRTGWVFYSPLRTQIIEYPTFVQTVKWTADTNEGHPVNEELVFNSKEGQEVRADVSLSYAIDSAKIPDFYVKYRSDDLERFTHGILKDIVRNSLNEMASTYTLEDIYGENKARFLTETRQRVQTQLEPVGVQIQQFGFIGKRFTAAIEQAILHRRRRPSPILSAPETSWQSRKLKSRRRLPKPKVKPGARSSARVARPNPTVCVRRRSRRSCWNGSGLRTSGRLSIAGTANCRERCSATRTD